MIFPVDASIRIADLEVKLSSSAVTLIWADDRISIKEIIKEKKAWNLKSFNKVFAIKVFQTTGRAITQSRYNKWNSYGEQRKYLKKIRQDKMFIANLKYLNNIKENLQRDHYLLLYLLKVRFYLLIIIMLRMKNILDN